MPRGNTGRHKFEVGVQRAMFFPHGLGVVDVGAPLTFLTKTAAKIASDALPNTAPLSPNDASVIQAVANDVITDLVLVVPFWTGATQVVTITAWQYEAGEADANQHWRPVTKATLDPAAPSAVPIPTNGRPVFVQVTSGADAGHPVELHFDVA